MSTSASPRFKLRRRQLGDGIWRWVLTYPSGMSTALSDSLIVSASVARQRANAYFAMKDTLI